MPKILLKPDQEGNLVIPKELLEGLDASQGFEVNVEPALSLEQQLEKAASQYSGSPHDSYKAAQILQKMLEGK